MKSRTSIAGRITGHVMGLALVLALGLSAAAIFNTYNQYLDRVIDHAVLTSREGIQQQIGLYFQDRNRLLEQTKPFCNRPR